MSWNDDPSAPWNDPHADDPSAPWNNPTYRDDPFAPWNDPLAGRREYDDWKRNEREDGPEW